jgi:hypothetical protein
MSKSLVPVGVTEGAVSFKSEVAAPTSVGVPVMPVIGRMVTMPSEPEACPKL